MTESDRVVELIKTIAVDPALRDRLSAASDSDRAAILTELGYGDVTPADISGSAHLFVPQVVEETDDDELDSVAGGGGAHTEKEVAAFTMVAAAAAAT